MSAKSILLSLILTLASCVLLALASTSAKFSHASHANDIVAFQALSKKKQCILRIWEAQFDREDAKRPIGDDCHELAE
jgi:hypothetical protein